MSYMQMAQLDVLNLLKGINTEGDYMDFRNMLARYFADKAQKQIDTLWENGTIDEKTVEAWGNERMSICETAIFVPQSLSWSVRTPSIQNLPAP